MFISINTGLRSQRIEKPRFEMADSIRFFAQAGFEV